MYKGYLLSVAAPKLPECSQNKRISRETLWKTNKSILLGHTSDFTSHKSQGFKIMSFKLCCFVHFRVLYGNKITELPKGIFDGLVSLQLL